MNDKTVKTARWFGLLLAAMTLMAIVAGMGSKPSAPTDDTGNQTGTVEIVVPCPSEDSCDTPIVPNGWHADYRQGAWHITNEGQS